MNPHNFFTGLKQRKAYKVRRTNSLGSELKQAALNQREHSRIFSR